MRGASTKGMRPLAPRPFVESSTGHSRIRQAGFEAKRKALKASELADRAAEHLVDKSIPAEERQRRKRALIKGPKEFRDIREDQPKSKT